MLNIERGKLGRGVGSTDLLLRNTGSCLMNFIYLSFLSLLTVTFQTLKSIIRDLYGFYINMVRLFKVKIIIERID